MARRTVRRMPMTNDTDLAEDVEYGYANFASFKGLCDDKNYLGIDQQTFEHCNNVYVDNDGQLASRPKLVKQTINALPINYNIVKIFNIHGVVFYHVIIDDRYEVHFNDINSGWQYHDCGKDLNIGWFTDKFYFFTTDTIFAYDYDTGWLSADSIIYRPVTKQVRNNIIYTYEDDAKIDSPNIFGGGEITRYFYSNTSSVEWSSLDGKTAVVRVGNRTYEIILTNYSRYTFVSPVYQGSINRAICNNNNGLQIVAWNINTPGVLYYSVDGGGLFQRLPDVTNTVEGGSEPVLSQDGSRLFVLNSQLIGGDNNTDVGEEYTLSRLILTPSVASVWNVYTKRIQDVGNVTTSQGSTKWRYGEFTKNTLAVGYCNDGDQVVFARPTRYDIFYHYEPDGSVFDCHGFNVYTFNGTSLFDFFDNGFGDGPSAWNWDAWFTDVHNVRCVTSDNRTYVTIYGVKTYQSSYQKNSTEIHTIVLNNNMVPYVKTIYKSTTWDTGEYFTAYRYYINRFTVFDDIGTTQDIKHTVRMDISEYNALPSDSDIVVSSRVFACSGTGNNVWRGDCSVTLKAISNNYNVDGAYGDSNVWFNSTEDVDATKLFTAPQSFTQLKVYETVSDELFILTNNFYYTNGTFTELFHNTITPVSPMFGNGVLYVQGGSVWLVNLNNEITIDIVTDGSLNAIVPSFICEFINDVISYENKICWQTPESDGDGRGLLYFAQANEQRFPSEVTALTLLSQTEVAIFFENDVRIFVYTDNGYIIQRSKLQLGCRKGYDVILNYDGATTLLCTIKGLTAISYQDFVQSTDQVFTYLSNNILSAYENFAISPIKLYQYKNWIVLYRQDDATCYLYDLRNNSWWRWSCNHNIQQIIYDNENLLVIIDGKMHVLVSDDKEQYYDFGYEVIDWSFRSQKLHFDAPNNYKHVNQLLITSTQDLGKPFLFNLVLTCYRNLIDISDKVAYDYEVDGLKTFIKRMNFIKINAFQFEISNYKNQNSPRQFATPNIAIKYRITERIR